MLISKYIDPYFTLVEQGKIVACKEQHQFCAHIRKCFAEETLIVDEERLETYFGYQKYFPYNLFPWETAVFALHCGVFREDGLPRWPDLLLLLGRGAGKNGYLAFEDFCLLTKAHGVPKYDIDLCATNEEQAMRTFQDIVDVLENPQNKILSKVFYWNKMFILNRQTGSVLKFRTNNARGKDGLRSGKVDFDEVHEYEDYDNIRVYTGGLGKKPHPRRTYATTDGFVRGGVLDDLKATAASVLAGKEPDNGLLPFICKLDNKDEVHDENMWHKANPSLQYLPSLLEEMRKEYREVGIAASLQSAFVTKRMNSPDGNKDIEVTSWENIVACSREVPDLKGRSCVAGIDYAKTTDFASVGLLIPDGDTYYWITHSWLCSHSADIPRMKCAWPEWAAAGLITVVDDVEIAPTLITDWLAEQAEIYHIEKIALDNFRYALMKKALAEIGFSAKEHRNVKLVRPSDVMVVSPVVESKFVQHEFAYGDNPVMRWAINNTKMIRTGINKDTGNMTYGKIEGKTRKTDPFMALVAAMTIVGDIVVNEAPETPALGVWTFN